MRVPSGRGARGPCTSAALAARTIPSALAAVDWQKRATTFGPPQEHRVSREEFLADASKAGLRIAAAPTFLPHQYFLIMTRLPAR
jgi:hypothetical protein